MKEIRFTSDMPELTPIQSELTINSNPPTLDVRGDIFMPDGPGNPNQEPPIGKNIVPVEKPKIKPKEKIPATEGPSFAEMARTVGQEEEQTTSQQDVQATAGAETEGQTPPLQEAGAGGGEPPKEPPTETAAPQEPEDEDRVPQSSIEEVAAAMESLASQPETLKEAEEIRERIKAMGIRSEGMANVLPGSPDVILNNVITELNAEVGRVGAGNPLEAKYIRDVIGEVRELRDSARVDVGEANRLLGELNGWVIEAVQAQGGAHERYGFYLVDKDYELLDKDPMEWLDQQFDDLYNFAKKGQELTSPIVTRMQNVYGDAFAYVKYNKPDLLPKFQERFTIPFNAIRMRTSIGYKSIQNIQETAYALQTTGLIYGLSLEEGRVGAMFNRLDELLEDERLKLPEFHVTPELVNKLQDRLIDEQTALAEKGGLFSIEIPNNETEEQKAVRITAIKANARRAVRTAFDLFVSSQRMGVIVARGNPLKGLAAYIGDPASGPLSVYNTEGLVTGKFGIYDIRVQEVSDEVKLRMADDSLLEKGIKLESVSREDKLDLGKRLFRDLFAVPDFFTSGWRIEGIIKALNERLGKAGAEDFALFMRAKLAGRPESDDDAEKIRERGRVWMKIAQYRPEEVMRLFRERDNSQLDDLYNEMIDIDPDLELTQEDIDHNDKIDRDNENEPTDKGKITVYNKFKDKYGSVLRILREQNFQKYPPEQVDMAQLTQEQKDFLIQALGDDPEAGNNVARIYSKMQEHINREGLLGRILNDTKFEDTFARTLVVDDALLDRLELDTWGGVDGKKNVTPISETYGADQGGDALVRIWNDTANAIIAQKALINFFKTPTVEEKIKAAIEFGDATSQYNGENSKAECVFYTAGTLLILSKLNFALDAAGIANLPFRLPASRIQKILGPHMKPMSRDELRGQVDQIMFALVGHANNEKEKVKAMRFVKRLERLTEITGKDAMKRRAVSAILFLLLAVAIEGYEVTGVKQATVGNKG